MTLHVPHQTLRPSERERERDEFENGGSSSHGWGRRSNQLRHQLAAPSPTMQLIFRLYFLSVRSRVS